MDFYRIGMREIEKGPRKGEFEIYPDFLIGRSQDLMVRGRAFYAIWDEAAGLWSTDEYDVQRLVDEALAAEVDRLNLAGTACRAKFMRSFESNSWSKFRQFLLQVSDNNKPLDSHLTFANDGVKKTDYASRRLPYALEEGDHSAWDELVGTLYSIEEREKIEWAIGSVVSGDSKKIQKFLVFYGPAGTGKSTVLNIIEKLFDGYTTTFDAKALGSVNGTFSTEVFKGNPLVAIQQDGDLSKIEDNTRLNSIVSHENMAMNEKFKPTYTGRANAFLFMGTNNPVKISDAKSGIIRRLIDVHPTGVKIPANHYQTLISRVDFELGAIAYHCLQVYLKLGKNYYNGYRPLEMMLQTDIFFNFVEAHFDIFKSQDGTSLKQAFTLYKEWCAETSVPHVLPQYKVREELRNYFTEFKDRARVDGQEVRSYYQGFSAKPFKTPAKEANTFSLVMEETVSLLDEILADCPAQYGNADENPILYWNDKPKMVHGKVITPKPSQIVSTKLSDLDTSKLHFVQIPENHIVIDFDLKDINGDKSLERNLEAASVWPPTYAELSKGGSGVHLHYIFDGDVSSLAQIYSDGIEIKTLLGDASLRRRLSKCNNVPLATISSGLPLKEKKMLSEQTIKSERGLRDLIARNLQKKIHPGTKSSVDFIHKILEDAYASGMTYDVSDLRGKITAFANASTNQSFQALKVVQTMKWKGQENSDHADVNLPDVAPTDMNEGVEVVFDLEVYPNLFTVGWSYLDSDTVVRMINPGPKEIEQLFKMKLIGYNNRRYDNHILYAAFLGYNNEQLYKLSQRLISNDPNAYFPKAYEISYTDIFDYVSKKQGLKKWQIELGLPHQEMDLPWDEPVPDDRIEDVLKYQDNDVLSTKEVHKARKADWTARLILAELSGLTPNHTTQQHTARIIFGNDRRPQTSFKYTDLSKEFPGYEYDRGKSTYRGVQTGEGGYVYAEPGMYSDVALLDVASMHPTSIVELNLFGEYTKHFKALLDARLAIKSKDYEAARKMLDGKLAPYLGDPKDAEALSYALKIVINIVYGLTSAKFDNPFRDPRNKDNIVAKRGALFMVDLQNFVQEQGYTVAHIKTDSIKIPNATPEIIEQVMRFGEKYGYTFEHEATYDRFCLVNDAVYVAAKETETGLKWEAVGAQFAHPYVFKELFSHEDIEWEDLCETKQVLQGAMYLDYTSTESSVNDDEGMVFVGRTGRFVPVMDDSHGAALYRIKDGKAYAVTGTKGYRWLEADVARKMGKEVSIDMSYFDKLEKKARADLSKFGDVDAFLA